MENTQIAGISFMDGVAVEDVVKIFVACDLQTGNFNVSRLFWLTEDGEWMHSDVETIVVSVCVVTKPYRTYFCLGQDGKVYGTISGGGDFFEQITDAGTGKGKYGYVTQIREIASDVYVCGDQGQVYKRSAGGWAHIDVGLLHKERRRHDISHNSIDGTAPDNIYVVGDYGRIFYYDAHKWQDISYETNLSLQRVKCVGSEEIFVCGEHGLLLQGNRNGWKVIGDPELDATIWDLEMFNNKLYLAVEDKLMAYDGIKISEVDTKLTPPIDAYHLSSRNGVLWSIGENDLAFFDGKKWVRVVHPDNA
jgi:photosystem II stability/assembly factor-like uncharacterized protein